MKLSALIASYTSNMKLKAKLNRQIKLDDGTVFRKGTVSDILIKKDEDTYHFEAKNSACTVKASEITFI